MQALLTKREMRVVGIKQALRAVTGGKAQGVFVAKNAQREVLAPLVLAARDAGLPVYGVDTMEELGMLCRVQVPSSAAAVLKEPAENSL